MTTLAQVQEGLRARLDTIEGLRVYGFAADDVAAPAAIVQLPTIPDYRNDLGIDSFSPIFEVVVAVATASHARYQLELLPYLERTGVKSIFAVIEADRKLGNLDVDANVISARQLGNVEIGKTVYYGAAVSIQVIVGDG